MAAVSAARDLLMRFLRGVAGPTARGVPVSARRLCASDGAPSFHTSNCQTYQSNLLCS